MWSGPPGLPGPPDPPGPPVGEFQPSVVFVAVRLSHAASV